MALPQPQQRPQPQQPQRSQQPGTGPFAGDKFGLKQKILALSPKYFVCDANGNEVLFVHRPVHTVQSLVAVFGALGAAVVVGGAIGFVASLLPSPVNGIMGVFAALCAVAALIAVGIVLSPKRHVTFYESEQKRQVLLTVLQDQKAAFIRGTFTVQDANGVTIARFAKNHLYDFFRKRWQVYLGNDEQPSFLALEDSIVKAIARRLFGPLYGLLRTQFIVTRADDENYAIGEFNRQFTLFDRYTLDLANDRERTLDRRIAVALGVMLDTGERR